jgi:hypothetical protein
MLALKYLGFLCLLSVTGTLLGLATHFWRSEVGDGADTNADPVYERGRLVVPAPHEDRWVAKHVLKADWDSHGWWEFASAHNSLWRSGSPPGPIAPRSWPTPASPSAASA